MNQYHTAIRSKLGRAKHKHKWTSPAEKDRAALEGKAARNWPRTGSDKSNPFAPAVRRDTARSTQELAAGALRMEAYLRALVSLRAQLRGSVTEAADTVQSGCGIGATCASPDTADLASEVIEQDLALSLLGSASDTLEQVEAAIERITDGTYGVCVSCGDQIPAARLDAIPYAPCCVHCAAQQELVD